MDDTQEMEGEP